MVTAKQYIGDPITCSVEEIPQKVMDTYCWIESTFTMPDFLDAVVGKDVPHLGIGPSNGDKKYHKYYQWVCFFLFGQALCFYAPRYLWKTWERNRMRNLVENLNNPIIDKSKQNEQIENLLNYLKSNLNRQNFYAYRFFICEILNFINAFVQIFIVDKFLDNEFTTYGRDVINFINMEQERRIDPMCFNLKIKSTQNCSYKNWKLSRKSRKMSSYRISFILSLLSASLSSSLHIICDYHSIEFTEDQLYSCDGKDFYTDSNFHTVLTVEGVHSNNKSINDVQGIRIWDDKCDLQYFPNNLKFFFTNLVAVWFSDCMITEISSENFDGLENLIEIDLSWNRLEFLHGNLLKKFHNLKFLYLNDNRINYIGPNLIQPLRSIISIYLGNNICIDKNFFDFKNENNAIELRNFIIDVSIQCPLTLEIIDEYFDLEKNENKDILINNVKNIKNRGSQEILKIEVRYKLTEKSLSIKAKYSPKNYCSKKLCNTSTNSACNATGYWGHECNPTIRLVPFTSSQKQRLLDATNFWRSSIAIGSQVNATGFAFPTASQMNELLWDEEQSFMASLQIKTCLSHDDCHNTWYDDVKNKLTYSGQNLYYELTYYPTRPELEDVITSGVDAWFSEIAVSPISSQYNVQLNPFYEIGHFLTMSYDQTTTIGCIATQWEGILDKNGIPKYSRLTCNYFVVPFLGKVLYRSGDICSKCAVCDESDNNYGLCIIDPDSLLNQYSFNDTS
ncbi:hypothetical protein PVAND_014423 [Polypedilum vanderplanki]|uniref:Innexin n=1 Tax=Polypedilum vanderplanki TaxID=319348 RepID=A0A9J6B9L6_POLVA|nr:hypothetical protein PVAND_014423 [Polypedilum vanderplanki]